MKDGNLIGEVSFINEGPATATVRAMEPTRYLSWSKQDLRGLLMRNPTMKFAMDTVFSKELSRKLARQNVSSLADPES